MNLVKKLWQTLLHIYVRNLNLLAAQHEYEKWESKSYKVTKKCLVPKIVTFDDYKICSFKGKAVYREEILFEKKETFGVNSK